MSEAWTVSECSGLLTLLLSAGEAAENDTRLAQAIAKHVASCPTCTQAEEALARLVAGYRRAETSSLPDGVELRLLDRLCPLSAPRASEAGPGPTASVRHPPTSRWSTSGTRKGESIDGTR